MSTKRTAGWYRPGNNAKRLNKLCSTTLDHLPIETLERILVEAVVMEVKDMKLVKSAWKRKASQVVARLRTVCSQWSSVLTTDSFQNELNRTFDSTDEDIVRLDLISQFQIESGVRSVVALGPDIYALRRDDRGTELVIEVYDPRVVPLIKDVLYITGMHVGLMAACCKAASVYLACKHDTGRSIIRLTKTGPRQYQTVTWIERLYAPIIDISVSCDGCLVLLSTDSRRGQTIATYDPNGYLMQSINFDRQQTDIMQIQSVVRKSNGRFIFVATNGRGETVLREMSMYGETVRILESQLDGNTKASLADCHGRIVLDAGSGSDLVLLDAEFNLVAFSGPQTPGVRCSAIQGISVASDLTQMTSLVKDGKRWSTYRLVVFRFSED